MPDPAAPARRWAPTRAGNTFDKYASKNPVARLLVRGFLRRIDQLSTAAAPQTILDVGCGEGFISARLHATTGATTTLGLDRDSDLLRAAWAAHAKPGLAFTTGDAHALAHPDGVFDLVCAIEVLEQVEEPPQVLAELSRVARRHVLVSVPREPVWRALNVARGAYLRSLGNPPGHIHHFSPRAFVELVRPHGRLIATATPFPWTMVLLDVSHSRCLRDVDVPDATAHTEGVDLEYHSMRAALQPRREERSVSTRAGEGAR